MVTGLTQAEAAARSLLVDVESYAVHLDLTAGPGTVLSRTEIRFRCRQPGAATFADLAVTAVTSIVVNGASLDPATVLADGRLRLDGLAASNVLTVDAHFPDTRSGLGLTRFTDPADGAAYLLAWCFPTHAPMIFCCFDQPDLRADLTLTLSAPAGWDVVANGAVTGRPAAGAAGGWRFASVHAMKPYELTLCAGPYVTAWEREHAGRAGPVRVSVRCRRTLARSPGLDRAGDVVRRVLAFYEGLLGVASPYAKCDVVFVPEFGPLAACLPGVITASEELLQRLAEPGDDHAALVLAHEVAHLWFGCLVEGRWWDDLWLAEALATYLSYVAAADGLGLDSPWADFALRGQADAYRADTLPSTQPVCSPVATAADAMTRPAALTYSKGASIIRQLAALIGPDALRAGLRDYLITYGGTSTTLADLIGCWSRASRRDLTPWARQWLLTPGVSTLRPELALTSAGAIQSLTIVQEAPSARPAPRTHRIGVGLYDSDGDRLRRRRVISAEISGARTPIPEFSETGSPAALIVNDGDLTFARVRFDDRSLQALLACALDVGDPLTEAVCWNALWDLTTAGELSTDVFTEVTARAVRGRRPITRTDELLARAVTAADYYARPEQRPQLRQRTATAALDGAARAEPGSPAQRALAVGFAASAHSDGQLGLLRSWLNGVSPPGRVLLPDVLNTSPPDGPPPDGLAGPGGRIADLELRGQILATLAARGLATDADLDAFAAADPVRGEEHRATCRALRPDPAAKRAAWAAAIAADQPPRLAQAHARGIWAPGQEALLVPFRDRYFSEALPVLDALAVADARTAQRLARLLYPATLADPATIAATTSALERDLTASLRLVLAEQRAILQQVLTARAAAAV